MEFNVLGSFEIVADGEVMSVTAPKQRELLALLLINANNPLSNDRIIDELWGEDPPGVSTLRFHVSKLRGLLGGDPSPLVTTENGYRLDVDPGVIDASRFEAALSKAGETLKTDLEAAAAHIERADRLWRGAPYPGAEYRRFGEIEIRRLNELHLTFLAREMEISLAQGRHDEAVSGLEGLVTRHPLHERFWELLMLALYRSGRQAEALRAYRRAKDILGEELGIDPSAALSNLEEQILLQAPAISYVSATPSNLPTPASSFIGRDSELAELVALCLTARMVTLIGPGGIGKTRLAVEVGHRVSDQFPGGTWFCDLAGAGPHGVSETIIASLPIQEEADADPLETIVAWAADRAALLVVDNCEHVIEEAGDTILALVTRCPRVYVLATSRERLGVDGEHLWDLDGLGLPSPEDAADRLLESEAVQLLVDRARRADRTFHFARDEASAVADLAIALDGMPLALELAAARLRTATVEDMLAQIRIGLTALDDTRRRGPARHQTMNAAVDWSYQLLDDHTAAVWRRLGVFRGGIDPVAAAAVAGGDDVDAVLERLVDVSLLKIDRNAPTRRYRMLEVIREYAESLLDPAERATTVNAHTDYFAGFAAGQAELMDTGERATAIDALRRDHANLRHAISNAREARSPNEIALVANLGPFWFDVGFHSEARTAFAAAIDDGDRQPSKELESALEQLVQLYSWSGALDRAYELADQQAEVAEALNDEWARTRLLATHGILGFITGDYRTAIDAYEGMLRGPDTGKTASVAYVAASLAYLYTWTGDSELAEQRFETAMGHADRFSLDDRDGIAGDYRGWAAFQRGDHQEALTQWRTAEAAYGELGLRPMQADMRQLQGWVLLAAGDQQGAVPLIQTSTTDMEEVGLIAFVARGQMLGAVATFGSDERGSLDRIAAALRVSHSVQSRPTAAWCLWYGAHLAARQGRVEDCAYLRGHAERLLRMIPLELPAGFRDRDAELLDLVGTDAWAVPKGKRLDVEAAGARLLG